DIPNPDDVKATEDDAEAELAELDGSEPTPDGAVQTEPSLDVVPGPSLSFDGLNNDNNLALLGGRVVPPDTVGDVGPNHYVQMINSVWRVFNKAGAPLTPAHTLASIFSALPGSCATSNDGDGIVLYDPLADRWLLSEFCVKPDPFDHQLIAISQTG